MKKLIFLLVFLLLVPCALATDVTLTLSKPEVAQGEILMDVSISEVEDFGSATFTADYRKSILSLKDGKAGDFVPGAVVTTSRATGDVNINAPAGEHTGEGQIVRLIFTALKEEEATIRLKNIEISNSRGMKIDAVTTSNEVKYTPGEEEEETQTTSETGLDRGIVETEEDEE